MAAISEESPVRKSTSLLTRDSINVPGQRYALISFVGPSMNQKTEKYGLKIRGCFNTPEEAQAHVKEIMDVDPMFDVYLVNMYEWLLIPPDNSKIQDAHYQEEYLETLLTGYRDNQKKAKQMFEQRKMDVVSEGIDKHLLPDEKIEPPTAMMQEMMRKTEPLGGFVMDDQTTPSSSS